MSGSPKNIQRDGWHVRANRSETAVWGIPYGLAVGDGSAWMDGTVYQTHADYSMTSSITLLDNQIASAGVLFESPVGDRVPFRVKASIVDNRSNREINGAITVGWVDSAAVGGENALFATYHIGFIAQFDDLLVIAPPPATHAGKLLGICVTAVGAGAVTDELVVGNISVQNLAVRPPTMRNAVP